MSTKVMALCWPLQMPPSPKAVLISLADNANDHGECWPSLSHICERTCLGKTAVINAIKWLESAGLVMADRSNGRHSRYVIDVRALDQQQLFPTEPVREANRFAKRTGTAGEPNRCARRTTPVREADTNRKEPSRTKNKSNTPPAAALPDPPEWIKREAWDGFVAMRKRIRAPLTDRAAELVFIELRKLAPDHDPSEVLDQSTRNGWRGVFPLRSANGETRNEQTRPREDAATRAARRFEEIASRAGIDLDE